MSNSPVRIDKWLWCVRVTKTRKVANDLCSTGRVRVNGETAKPATKVRPDDVVSVRQRGETRVLRVVLTLEKRVGAAIASDAFVDESPQPPRPSETTSAATPVESADGHRERGAGRPTKRDRRMLDRLRREARQR